MQGRDYVLPDDIQYLTRFVLDHRLIILPEAKLRGLTVKTILDEIIETVPLPLKSDQ